MSTVHLLTLIAPVSLEEVLVDWLLQTSPSGGFCSGPINGHGAHHERLSLAEQVAGRERRIRFEVHADELEITDMLAHLRQTYAGTHLHYWITPISEVGTL